MSKIKVSQGHTLSRDEARQRLGSFEETLQKYGAKLDWNGDRAEVKGIGVSGDVTVRDENVEISLKLGLIAKAAGVDPVRLQASIEKRLKAAMEDEAEA